MYGLRNALLRPRQRQESRVDWVIACDTYFNTVPPRGSCRHRTHSHTFPPCFMQWSTTRHGVSRLIRGRRDWSHIHPAPHTPWKAEMAMAREQSGQCLLKDNRSRANPGGRAATSPWCVRGSRPPRPADEAPCCCSVEGDSECSIEGGSASAGVRSARDGEEAR